MYTTSSFKVDFIGVGFPKCGTTWLSACLSEHPGISFSIHKETDYFLNPNSAVAKKFYEPTKPHTFADYKKEFLEDATKIRGEFSVYYIYDTYALNKIKETFPEVKILICIRNPLNFLNSAYWFYRSSRYPHLVPRNFESAVLNASSLDLYHLERVNFYEYIKNCFETFGRDKVLVLTTDEIKSDPKVVLKNVYNFIGVDSKFVPSIVFNKFHDTKSIYSENLSKITYFVFEFLKKNKLLFYFYDKLNYRDRLYRFYNRLFKRKFNYPSIPEPFRHKLLTELLPGIEKLESLLNRDLSQWKK